MAVYWSIHIVKCTISGFANNFDVYTRVGTSYTYVRMYACMGRNGRGMRVLRTHVVKSCRKHTAIYIVTIRSRPYYLPWVQYIPVLCRIIPYTHASWVHISGII
jgi:hypothetical protein